MTPPKLTAGWREWLRLPDLGVERIKAKVDTGARTSALHAEDAVIFRRGGKKFVRFSIYPIQRSRRTVVRTVAPLIAERSVRASNGEREVRPVIRTNIELGGEVWPIELTLARRDTMGFRMLLGRQAIRKRALVDPGRSFLTRPAAKRPSKKG